MAIEWKDATSYSQGQRGKIDPTSWECKVQGVRIWVTRGNIYYPGEWIMNSDALGFDKKHLGRASEMSVSDVLAKALALAGAEAKRLARDLIEFAKACEAQP